MIKSQRIDWLDYGRLFSAISVMAFHYMYRAPADGTVPGDFGSFGSIARYGFLGVDFFFIVSGFVILFSAVGSEPDRFAVARLVRLYPAFLFCMIVTLSVRLASGHEISPLSIFANLTLVPEIFGQPAVDGVYWSLAFEIVFYVAVFLIMLIGGGRYLRAIILGWVFVQAATYPWHLPLLSGFYSLFAGGAVLAYDYRDGWSWSYGAALTVTVILSVANASNRVGGDPAITAGVTAAFFAIFIVMSRAPRLPGAQIAGAITYPVYLLHNRIGMELRQFFNSGWAWFIICTLLFCSAGWLISVFIERRPRRVWFAIFDSSVGSLIRFARRRRLSITFGSRAAR